MSCFPCYTKQLCVRLYSCMQTMFVTRSRRTVTVSVIAFIQTHWDVLFLVWYLTARYTAILACALCQGVCSLEPMDWRQCKTWQRLFLLLSSMCVVHLASLLSFSSLFASLLTISAHSYDMIVVLLLVYPPSDYLLILVYLMIRARHGERSSVLGVIHAGNTDTLRGYQ